MRSSTAHTQAEAYPSLSPASGYRAPQTRQQPEDRIRAALGVNGEVLPGVGKDMLRRYYHYLASNLFLPFEARYPEPVGLHEEIVRTVLVVGLRDPAMNFDYDCLGLVCKVWQGQRESELPLADLEVDEDDPNYRLVEDYWYWFWNCQ